ncbi:MAG: DUF1648 domain-containing protein [Tannerella sp.]|jgi:uncharacterized membrane protein|nr:DUF1648 domain-containing protein [Tannerella sp.]
MNKRPKTVVIIAIEISCVMLLLAHVGTVCCLYDSLPERISAHYNFKGLPDGYGEKSSIFGLPAISFAIYLVMTFLYRKPEICNYPVPVTDENRTQLYNYTRLLIRYLKLIFTIVFFYITVCTLYGQPLGLFFSSVIMLAIFGPAIYVIIKMWSLKTPAK